MPFHHQTALLFLAANALYSCYCGTTKLVGAFVVPDVTTATKIMHSQQYQLQQSRLTPLFVSSTADDNENNRKLKRSQSDEDAVMEKINAAWAQISQGTTTAAAASTSNTSINGSSRSNMNNNNNNTFRAPRPPTTGPSPSIWQNQSLQQQQQRGAVPVFPPRPRNTNNNRPDDPNQKVMEQYRKGVVAGQTANNNDNSNNYIPTTTRELQAQDLLHPVQLALAKQNRRKRSVWQQVASQQTCIVGAVVGAWTVAPFLAVHHFWFDPQYQSLAAWEWDTLTAVVQGALYAATYRYAIREEIVQKNNTTNNTNNQDLHHTIQNTVLAAFVLVRSLVRVHVPLQCLAAPLLMCKFVTIIVIVVVVVFVC